jgi:hypothetical protein
MNNRAKAQVRVEDIKIPKGPIHFLKKNRISVLNSSIVGIKSIK